MAKDNTNRRQPDAARRRITIRAQTIPDTKLPSTPDNAARNPRFTAKNKKEQMAGANKTTKKRSQFVGGGCSALASVNCSPVNPFPQAGQ
jgi:hypothetical protein